MRILNIHTPFLHLIQEVNGSRRDMSLRELGTLDQDGSLDGKLLQLLSSVDPFQAGAPLRFDLESLSRSTGQPPALIMNRLTTLRQRRILGNSANLLDMYELFRIARHPGFIVGMITVEEGDDERIAQAAALELCDIAEQVGASRIILLPFIHLSSRYSKMEAHRAGIFDALKRTATEQSNHEIVLVEERINKFMTISVTGHRLGTVLRQFPEVAGTSER